MDGDMGFFEKVPDIANLANLSGGWPSWPRCCHSSELLPVMKYWTE